MFAIGQLPRVGVVREGTVAIELKFAEDMVGGRCGVVRLVVVMLAHGMLRRS
jgi:hypothetical protein